MPRAQAGAPVEQHRKWMLENFDKYIASLEAWENAVARGLTPFPLLLDAHEEITMVWLNALDAGDEAFQEQAEEMNQHLRAYILKIMHGGCNAAECRGWWNSYKGDCCRGFDL